MARRFRLTRWRQASRSLVCLVLLVSFVVGPASQAGASGLSGLLLADNDGGDVAGNGGGAGSNSGNMGADAGGSANAPTADSMPGGGGDSSAGSAGSGDTGNSSDASSASAPAKGAAPGPGISESPESANTPSADPVGEKPALAAPMQSQTDPNSFSQQAPSSVPGNSPDSDSGKPLPAVPYPPANDGPSGDGELTQQTPVSSIVEERVMRLEQVAFGSTYPEHDMADRIGHLEEEILKAKGKGAIEPRVSRVEAKVFGSSAFGQTPAPRQNQTGSPGYGFQPPRMAQSAPPPYHTAPVHYHSVQPAKTADGSENESLHQTDASAPGNLQALTPLEAPPIADTRTQSQAPPPKFASLTPYTAPPSGGGKAALPDDGFDPQPPMLRPATDLPLSQAPPAQTPPAKKPPTQRPTQGGPPQVAQRPPQPGQPQPGQLQPGQPQQGQPQQGQYPQPGQYPAGPQGSAPYNQTAGGYPPPGYPPQYGYRPPGAGYPPGYPYAAQQPYQYPYPGYRQPGQQNQPPGVVGGAPPYMASAAPPYAGYPAVQNPYGAYGMPPPGYPTTGYPQPGAGNVPRTLPGTNPAVTQTLVGGNSPSDKVASAIPADAKAGDYFGSIRKFAGETTARWQTFPVNIHLPLNSPDSWRRSLDSDIRKWSEFVPMKPARDTDSFDIDVKWVNHLPPKVFGVTRVEYSGGRLKTTIFVLRPTFYPAEIPETTLQPVFLHELGHAVGILGHSGSVNDVMYNGEDKTAKKGSPTPHALSLTARDLNTLKKLYSSPAVPANFQLQQPLEFSSSD